MVLIAVRPRRAAAPLTSPFRVLDSAPRWPSGWAPCRACAGPHPTSPGWTRRRAGKGFVYLDEYGKRLVDADAQRVRDLVIPPAWKDVWVTPYENGHLQAVGTDEAGRRQYLYHPDWRSRRDAEKFDRVLQFGKALSRARERVLTDLGTEGMDADARLRGRRTPARPGLLPDRQRRLLPTSTAASG